MMLSGDGNGRRFVADQNGIVYQLHDDLSLSVFLDLRTSTDLLANQRQQGLSSFAFHPDFTAPGTPGFRKFYTASSQVLGSGVPDFPVPPGAPMSHDGVIHEWEIDSFNPDAIDPASAREILRIGQPYNDHNIGQIGFNPNATSGDPDYGLLYIAVGDGGNVGSPRPTVDPHFVGQDLSSPLGTLLRIDPLEAADGAPYRIPSSNPFAADAAPDTLGEIYAYGLRNPHRFSWDTAGSGSLLISDIGQANVEEINLGAPGANYGWSEREGTFLVVHDNELEVFDLPIDDETFGFTYPVVQYDHDEEDKAISGGYVYRGSQVPTLAGEYVFGDLVSGRIFYTPAAGLDGTAQAPFQELRLIDATDGVEKSLLELVGGGIAASRADLRFGIDDNDEIYLVTKQDGGIRSISSPTCDTGPDCTESGVSVSNIGVQLEDVGKRHTRAAATVTIVDESGAPVPGATAYGQWSGLVDENQTGNTDQSGNATFTSPKISKSASGQFVFSVTDVIVAGYVYDPVANVETSDCVGTDGAPCNEEPNVLHVSEITVTLNNLGKNWSGESTVTVLDSDGVPVSEAVLSGLWTFEPSGTSPSDLNQVVGNTDTGGQITTSSSKVRASTDDGFRFTVTDISRGNDTYDPGASIQDGVAYVP